ncbi:MAG: N-acetylmuramoyl-L-alanine amidase [Butyrivibrio sp.]|jgi:N-acetylmuramoyl-L-alanine amidase|nr:N-acetylmuramoyl-L-alanine amidase [Butyrivibrio sp.]
MMIARKVIFALTILPILLISGYSNSSNISDDYRWKRSLIGLEDNWKYAEFSVIHEGFAVLYTPVNNKNEITVAINAGHGTNGGEKKKTQCHPDGSPKITGGTTSQGAVEAIAVSTGMVFSDGTREAEATLEVAHYVKDILLEQGYNVLMLRDSEDVQLDNVARIVISNNTADCMISFHWDGDNLNYDKGVFFIKVPEGLKEMDPVSSLWEKHDELGSAIVESLEAEGFKKYNSGSLAIDLTQTSYSEIPSVDIELGNQCSLHDTETLKNMAKAVASGIALFCANK